MRKNINFLIEKSIAHRGLWNNEIAENSLSAFSRAVDKKYPIELDAQITTDGTLVVFHDWTLERMTGIKGELSHKTYSDIKNAKLQNTNQTIPLFEDVLDLVDGDVPIIVEIKSKSYLNFDICKKVYDVLKKYNGKYAISSFNPFVVSWFAKNAPEVVRGQNFTNFGNRNFMIAFMKKMFLYVSWIKSNNRPDFFVIRAQMIPHSFPVHKALKNKKSILAYAVKDYDEYVRIKDIIDNEFFIEIHG